MTPSSDNGYVLSNERLEFLGDAILNSVVTDILFNRFERQREGFLTNTRSKLVKRDFLNRLAIEIGLDQLVVKSRHIHSPGHSNIYGNAFEALMGAIYLDYGYKKCKKFLEKRVFGAFVDIQQVVGDETNYKSLFIEYCQKHHLHYEFLLVEEVLDAPNKHRFTTRLIINGNAICEASGSSKKESHQIASFKAYEAIRHNPELFVSSYTDDTFLRPQPEHADVDI